MTPALEAEGRGGRVRAEDGPMGRRTNAKGARILFEVVSLKEAEAKKSDEFVYRRMSHLWCDIERATCRNGAGNVEAVNGGGTSCWAARMVI